MNNKIFTHDIEEDAANFLILMDNNNNNNLSVDCCQETIINDIEYFPSFSYRSNHCYYHSLGMNVIRSSKEKTIAKSDRKDDLSDHHDIYHDNGDMMKASCHSPIPSMSCNSDNMIDNGDDDLLIIHQCNDVDNKRTGIGFIRSSNGNDNNNNLIEDGAIIHKRMKSNHDMPDPSSLMNSNVSNGNIIGSNNGGNNSFYLGKSPSVITSDYNGDGNLNRHYKGPLIFKPSNSSTQTMQSWSTPNKFYNPQCGVAHGIKIGNNSNNKRCSNCGSTNTPSWRRCPKGKDLLCNACGLYAKLHNRPRPFKIGDDGSIRVQRQQMNSLDFEDGNSSYINDNHNPIIVCANCDTMETPLWRRGENGRIYCNACALYYRTHNSHRPKQYYYSNYGGAGNVANGINKEPPSTLFADNNGDYDPSIFSHFP